MGGGDPICDTCIIARAMTSERVKRRIDRLLDEAEDAADRGDWDAVSIAADRVLSETRKTTTPWPY